jgi:sialidase-1
MRTMIGLMLSAALLQAPAAEPSSPVDVFTGGMTAGGQRYAGIRVPALLRLADGTLLAFAEGRVDGLADHGDVDTLLSRSADDGRTWSAPVVVAEAGAAFVGNPAPVLDAKTGAITVLLGWKAAGVTETAIRNGKAPACAIWAIRSGDGGRTWSAPGPAGGLIDLAAARGWRWNLPSPCHGIQLAHGAHAGRLVVAGNHSTSGGAGNQFLGAHLLLSDDGGSTWRVGGADIAPEGGRAGRTLNPNESTVAERDDGVLVVHTRDQGGAAPGTRAATLSRDGGETLVAPFAMIEALVAPVCQGALLAGHDATGAPLLIASMAGHPDKREKLLIRLSRDGGATWSDGPLLHAGAAAYSDVAELAPGRFLAVAELDGYRRIAAIAFILP